MRNLVLILHSDNTVDAYFMTDLDWVEGEKILVREKSSQHLKQKFGETSNFITDVYIISLKSRHCTVLTINCFIIL